jgi:hypothetical protein
VKIEEKKIERLRGEREREGGREEGKERERFNRNGRWRRD